ncbi:hypothetical protein LTR22_027542 [Elasticomyces elasticus]|nr:hypothetical protein LTR22_027542 [Elasticomyces elasticus]
MAHISTLSRSTSSLHSQKSRRAKHAQAPTPPPEKSLPALPSDVEHPGFHGARAGVLPQCGIRDPEKIKRTPLMSELPTTPTLRTALPYKGADLRSHGA